MEILVPLDGSECSESALGWAKFLAQGMGASIRLLRSYLPLENVHLAPELPITVAELVNEKSRRKAIGDYLSTVGQGIEGVKVQTSCIKGSAADSILGTTADLIVMASHGYSGAERWLLGSVATKVVRGSERSVLIVNSREGQTAPPVKLDRILVALDESERAEAALKEAAGLARAFGSTLILYEAIVSAWKTAPPETWAGERAAEYLIAKSSEYSDLKTERVVHCSSIGPEIVERAEELQADLIVVCSHGRSGLSRWVLGSVTESVVQRANCPVLVCYNRPADQ